MDTIMTVNVLDENGEAAVQAARAEIDRLEQMLSRTREDSVIALLNTHAGDGSALAVEPELGALLRFAQSVSQDLPGCFDITIAPVMDAWGFTREERHVPDPDTLADTLALVDWRALTVAEDDASARLEEPGMAVDLGAVAKGFGRPARRRCHPGRPEAPPPCWSGGQYHRFGFQAGWSGLEGGGKRSAGHRASVGRGLSAGQNAFHLRRV